MNRTVCEKEIQISLTKVKVVVLQKFRNYNMEKPNKKRE